MRNDFIFLRPKYKYEYLILKVKVYYVILIPVYSYMFSFFLTNDGYLKRVNVWTSHGR